MEEADWSFMKRKGLTGLTQVSVILSLDKTAPVI